MNDHHGFEQRTAQALRKILRHIAPDWAVDRVRVEDDEVQITVRSQDETLQLTAVGDENRRSD